MVSSTSPQRYRAVFALIVFAGLNQSVAFRARLIDKVASKEAAAEAFVPLSQPNRVTVESVRRSHAAAPLAAAPQAGTVVDVNPRSEGLALALDDGTRKSHSVAENTAFVTGFFKGLGQKESFSQLVAGLYFVYDAMESEFTQTADEGVRKLDMPELRRVPSLELDMEYFFGKDWRSTVAPSSGAAKYAARVREIAQGEKPYLLIAHQYTRYLGDLFGGQMMGSMATKTLKLEGGQGIAFYRFEDIPNPKDFITNWYSELNSLPLTAAQKQEIIDEANYVFTLNIELFGELEGSPVDAVFALVVDSVVEGLRKTNPLLRPWLTATP
jgi:heme oxygenase